MSAAPNYYPIQGPLDAANDQTMSLFIIERMLRRLAGATLVRVVSCTNAGGVAGIGRVNVQPLVNQLNGNGQPTPHGTVYNLLYSRLQCGTNGAIIMDPQENDIGAAIFASRDISAVKNAAIQAFGTGNPVQPQNPGSLRYWDWADGIYMFSVLAQGVPTQYIQFLANAINIYSPNQINLTAQQITLTAPTVTVNASAGFNVNTPQTTLSGALSVADDAVIGGIGYLEHIHGGVQTGGGTTAPPQA
jgi:hypothetical protein